MPGYVGSASRQPCSLALPAAATHPSPRSLLPFRSARPHHTSVPGCVGAAYCSFVVVRGDDPAAITSCFTSAYGKSPVRSGSYLITSDGLRRFSPEEILRLLGFPRWFSLPPELRPRTAWKLVGNGRRDEYVEPDAPIDPNLDKRINSGLYAVAPAPDGSVWGSNLHYPGAIVRVAPGDDPTNTALTEYYELPLDENGNAIEGFSPRTKAAASDCSRRSTRSSRGACWCSPS